MREVNYKFFNKHTDLKILGIFLLIWCYISFSLLLTPWLSGYDSITRIYYINNILVGVLGEVWVPLYQLILRQFNIISENIYFLKTASYLIAIAAMIAAYYATLLSFNRIFAIAVLTYFIMHMQWIGVATSLYMEPVFILNLALAIIFFNKQKHLLFALFFILATFSRPELCVAAPALALAVLYYKKSIISALKFSSLYIPVILFYVWIKLDYSAQEAPHFFKIEDSLKLLSLILTEYLHDRIYQIQAVLAVIGAFLIYRNKAEYAQQKILKLIPVSLLIFIFTFAFIIPYFHQFSGGGTRKSMYLLIPALIYSAIALHYFFRKNRELSLIFIAFYLGVIVSFSYYSRDLRAPDTYKISSTITKILRNDYPSHYSPAATHYYCQFDQSQLLKKNIFPVYTEQILYYLKSMGWKLEPIDCRYKNANWKKIAASNERFILRIYDLYALNPAYRKEIEKDCKVNNLVRIHSRIVGRYCF